VKDKTIEKDIIKEYSKLIGMSEVNAKFRYIQLCRSLKTYGITTFVVKLAPSVEQQKKQKKPQKVLLGITRDSIMFLNFETKVKATTTLATRALTQWFFRKL
jgi:talin